MPASPLGSERRGENGSRPNADRARFYFTRPCRAASNAPTLTSPTPRRFWDHLVYTRMAVWGRDFNSVARCVITNLWEGMGIPLGRYGAQGLEPLHLHEDSFVMIFERVPPEVRAAFGVIRPRINAFSS